MTAPKKPDPQDVLDRLIRAARAAGADAADAVFLEGVSSSVAYRLGKLEDVERAESSDLGLRVFVGERTAFVSSTDLSARALGELPERAVAMARLAPEDKFACLAPPGLLAQSFPDLDLEDAEEPSAERLIELARAVEGAALAVKGVTNSEGGGASFGRSAITLATSEGFLGALCRHQSFRRRLGPGRRRHRHGDRLRKRQRPLRERSGTSRGSGPQGRRAHGRQIEPAQSEIAGRAGDVRSARVRRSRRQFRRRHQRRLHRPRRQLPEGQDGPDGFRARHHHRGRPAPIARPALQAVRRRRRGQQADGADRRRRAENLAARLRQRQAIGPHVHRPCRARHRRAAAPRRHQSLYGAGTACARRS